MKKTINRFLIKTRLWVSLMIALLCIFFGCLNHAVNYNRIGIVFFSALSAYNFICFQNSWSEKILKKSSFYLVSLSLLLMAYFVFKGKNLAQVFHILFVGSIVIMYNSDIIKIPLRSIPLVKNFIISFAWGYSILFIGNECNGKIISEFLTLYLFIIGITIPFDICDMEEDTIFTIPKYLGIRKSKLVSCLCIFLSALLFVLTFHNQDDLTYLIAWEVTCMISMNMVVFMRKAHQFFFTRFWMEACSTLPLLVILLQKIRVVLF
jgi:hypothetical protein